MNNFGKDLLWSKRMELATALNADIRMVVKLLFLKSIISEEMQEDILAKETTMKQSSRLLELLSSRGPNLFQVFYEETLYLRLWDAANIIKPENAPHGSVGVNYVEDEPDEPVNWPNEKFTREVQHNRITVKTLDSKKSRAYTLSLRDLQRDSYVMKSRPRGHAIIINNENFTNFSFRRGSWMDQLGLERVFRKLHFCVIAHEDKTTEQMEKILTDECNTDHTDFDCFVLVLMSHGNDGIVFGTDGYESDEEKHNCITIQDWKKKLCTVKSLVGKPKLLFIQACQGEERDKGMEMAFTPKGVHEGMDVNRVEADTGMELATIGDSSLMDSAQAYDMCPVIQQALVIVGDISLATDLIDDCEANAAALLPTGFNIFVAISAIQGQVAWRNRTNGSWFIQALIYILANYSYKHDLHSLMNMVTNLVSRMETQDRHKQVVSSASTMTRKFFFFPGKPE